MTGPAAIFREVHRLRRYARDLLEQIDRIPRLLKAHKAKLEARETALRDAQEHLRKLKVSMHEKEVSLKTRHGQIARYEKQLNEAESKKEYDALQLEITHAKEDCSRLEDEILAGIEESDQKTAQVPELEKGVAVAREEFGKYEKEAATRKADLQAQLQKAKEDLKGVEATVPPELRESYNRVVQSRDADAFASVQDRSCTACYCEIPAQSYSLLRQQQFVTCKSCGRILYLPEEPPTAADEDE